jgi:hypothetical protein
MRPLLSKLSADQWTLKSRVLLGEEACADFASDQFYCTDKTRTLTK